MITAGGMAGTASRIGAMVSGLLIDWGRGMRSPGGAGRRVAMTAALWLGLTVLWAPPAAAFQKEKCVAATETLALAATLPQIQAAMDARKEVRIVALGATSTQGYGATSPFNSYPAELLRALARRMPGVQIKMLNRGVDNDDVADMLQRLDRDVLAEKPDAVIWEVGAEAALKGMELPVFRRLLAEGVDRMKAAGIDVVLMSPQFAPAIVALPNEEEYSDTIRAVARERGVGAFRRFEIMRNWIRGEGMPYAQFLASDGLNLNDFGYRCMGRLLATAMVRAIGP